jgi:hypothetical protein
MLFLLPMAGSSSYVQSLGLKAAGRFLGNDGFELPATKRGCDVRRAHKITDLGGCFTINFFVLWWGGHEISAQM